MAGVLRRWRAPLLGGVAVWLLSFPLVASHPTAITLASAAHPVETASSDAVHRGLIKEEQALAAMQVLAAAAASPMPLVAAPMATAVRPVAPPAPQAPPALVARANTIVIPR